MRAKTDESNRRSQKYEFMTIILKKTGVHVFLIQLCEHFGERTKVLLIWWSSKLLI